jgi:acyl-homoserine lactone acylase PvdQ
LGNWDNSLTVIPTGVSGIPSSRFYMNQTKLYISGKYHPDPFSKESVDEKAIYRMKLIPAINTE